MIPILSLIGFSNVGKSSIFDKVVLSDNIIDDFYRLTINRTYKVSNNFKYTFLLSDNKSIENKNIKNNLIYNLYLLKSDIFLYIIDIYENNFFLNRFYINFLKKKNKYIFLIINKIDLFIKINIFEILNLGLGKPYFVSAKLNFNIKTTFENILKIYCFNKNCSNKKNIKFNIKVIITGNTNTGKSTLMNCLFKEDQILVSKRKNSTKDIYFLNLKYNKYIITFIDTFGLKFRKNFKKINYFSSKTLKNIIKSNITIFLLSKFKIDWDYNYIKFIINNGLNFMILVNKSDLFNLKNKIFLKNLIKIKLKNEKIFIFFISSLKKKNIFYILKYIIKIFFNSLLKLNSNKLKKILNSYILIKKKFNNELKKIYIFQAGKNPLNFIIFSKNKFTEIKFFKLFLIKSLKIKSIGINIKNIKINKNN